MEIVTGVHQLRIPFPEGIDRLTNAYVIEGSRGCILVDCGWDNSEAIWAFREELRIERLSFEDINWIVITHAHPDHFGMAAKLRELCGARVVMHRADADLMHSRYADLRKLATALEEMLLSHGVPSSEAAEMRDASAWGAQYVTTVEPDVVVEEGDVVSNGTFQFDVLHTPGHTPGHMCLYDSRKGRLFTGDTVLFDAIPHIGVAPESGYDPAGDYIGSLERISEKSVRFVFPGHGPVFNGLGIRLTEILRVLDARQRQILTVLDEGLKDAYEVSCALPWTIDGSAVAYADLEPRERRIGVCEIIAWLRRLTSTGEIGALEQDGKTVYLAK